MRALAIVWRAGLAVATACALTGTLAGCATTNAGAPVEVTRFHLGAPLERGTLAVEPVAGGGAPSLEFKTYAAAVQTELLAAGYSAGDPDGTAQYLATVGFTRQTADGPPRRSPVSIGLGGGFGGGGYRSGGGIGGGVSFPIGRGQSRVAVLTELSVQIHRRSDGAVIWEGRAQTGADARDADANATAAAGKLAHALFLGFPGESGRTITVR